MRIRKRTPARAASPGPAPPLSPPPPPPLQQPKETPHGDEKDNDAAAAAEEEEKRVILVKAAGVERDAALPPASNNSAMDDAPKPPQAADARCSRTDGKRWRCKAAAVPGYLFCDRHVAWSTRKRKPRIGRKKRKSQGRDSFDDPAGEEHEADATKDEADARTTLRGGAGDDGFYYYGGFQPGSRKRARDSAPPA
ncbi:hypothetical protein ACP4OV_027849 [Aristida adscensionis]